MTATPGAASGVTKYARFGLNAASAASSLGFTAAKTGTSLGFGIARVITSTAASVAGTTVDYALFGGVGMVGPALGGAVSSVMNIAEQIALAPILLGETITSTSIVAAESSIDTLSSFFPGSDEASFSLASFVTLVRREWNEPALRDQLPAERYSVTEVAKALVAWAALQSITQEWQEDKWFKVLREIDVEDASSNADVKDRRKSTIHITSDAVFPHRRGQLVTADIGDVEDDDSPVRRERNRRGTSTSRLRPSHSELKSNLRRLSKIVLAGYGGAGLIFFGVSFTPTNNSPENASGESVKASEEYTLSNAVDASEREAHSSARHPAPSPSTPQQSKGYSWWNVLLGKHDKEIFEGYAFTPATIREDKKKRRGKGRQPTSTVGSEPNMPRYWILTDHGRRQVVLVFRGTMSLNELAVDLTCDPSPFRPARTTHSDQETVEEDPPDVPMPGSLPFPSMTPPPSPTTSFASDHEPTYKVHGGMLRMAQIMGEADKPVHRAVRDALRRNEGYELVLCGHSLGAGVAALLALSWADPKTCLTVRDSGLPAGRRVSAYCFAPPCLVCPELASMSYELITSFAYLHDIVARLSLGSVRDMNRAALWLCDANNATNGNGDEGEGYVAVTKRALKWRAGYGSDEDPNWFLSIRKTLEANMHMADLFPAGRVLWGIRDGDLSPSHRLSPHVDENKLRLFEVLDVEKMFGQIMFARDMLSSHLPHRYDQAIHEIL